jgi:hypothetical protein
VRMSAELRFIVDCCRWNFRGSEPAQLVQLPDGLDWPALDRLAHFHRVHGLVWNALEPLAPHLPDALAEGLATDARTLLATNLQTALECLRLLRAFQAGGIPLLFVKGLTVAALAYRAPLMKAAWDVDILVPPHQLIEAATLLKTLGYRIVTPVSDEKLVRWHKAHKDSLWRRSDPDIHLELHPRLVDNPDILSSVGIASPVQEVQVAPGVMLPTLAPDELFAYLCVHGASSAWFRLKWIADLAGLLHGMSPSRIEALYARSQDLGASRAAGQALLLCDHLFGTLEGCALRESLGQDRGVARLASAASKQITAGTEPTARRLGTWRIHWTQLLLKPGLRFKAGELARQVREGLG